ncbi:NAD+ synthase [Acidihalobacter ferrooxydans]|uniref:Glutamine-dependent NAD(+) synthetase n=1 Tax=Acidihalobacter ferrooxydans TaxID=1765967 RepID=A0A1P8UGD7_9GAMM|nr:NAD+ synthase [Acidihalobacter ferrooxydans]APZ42896.1 NAD+ synthase [Acidihalobacter ferrooxydans]
MGLKLALVQCNPLVGDVENNARLVIERATYARDELGAQLVVLPELVLTGYPPEDLLLRASLLERVEAALAMVAAETPGVALVVGAPYRDAQGLRNGAHFIQYGAVQARYAKCRLPNYNVFDEKRYFVEGTQPCVVTVDGVRVGVLICEDLWFPEPAQSACAAGADLLVGLNASPFRLGQDAAREAVLSQRARENGVAVVYVNQVGGQDELLFDGASMVLNPAGEVICRLPSFAERTALCDPWGGACERAALPDPDEACYEALVLGVRDYVRKNGFPGVVVGLSGGIDSALTLVLAVDALGADSVMAVMMPSRYTADMSREDARRECERLGVEVHELSIEPPFNAFLESLASLFGDAPRNTTEEFGDAPRNTTEENIQARCRGVMLMALSNKTGRMVLTTGNKSEMAVGYATLYGDMAGGFAPLKDVPKTLVYRLAHWRNSRAQAIPERVLTRPPSAELAPDQKDSDSLPSYEVLDPILERFVERDWSVAQIVADGYPREVVERVASLVLRNEYKRRQAPPGVRISGRAFGKDRRYPITSGYGRSLS